jgi:hypothetical protein
VKKRTMFRLRSLDIQAQGKKREIVKRVTTVGKRIWTVTARRVIRYVLQVQIVTSPLLFSS